MKTQYYLLFALLILTTSSSVRAGKYAADFLRIGVGARATSMGGAYTALANDASAFYWNPAGMAEVPRLALQFDHVPMFNGLAQYNVAHAALSLRNHIAIGVSWIRLGVDDIPRYAPLAGTRLQRLTTGVHRSTGIADGSFSDAEDAILVSFAKKISFELGVGPRSSMLILPIELSLGVTGKYISHKLDDKTGTGQGLDVGVLARTVSTTRDRHEPVSWLGLGVLARDVSRTSITWNTDSGHEDQVEPGLIAGLAGSHYFRSFESRLTLSVDQEVMPYSDTHIGAEFTFLHVASLRAGLLNTNFTAGAGLQFKSFRIDYAFVTHDLGNTHRVSGVVGL